MDFLDEAGNRDLAHRENKYWREVAEYDRYTVPLLVRLRSVDWTKLMSLHRAQWQRAAVLQMLSRRDKNGRYPWFGWYRNRLIQRYPLRPRCWFVKKIALPIPTPLAYAEREFEQSRALYAAVYAQRIEQERSSAPNERQYLADRLRSISRVLGSDKAGWEPQWQLKYFMELGRPAAISGYTGPDGLGEVQAKLDYFWLCLREFHEAEQPAPPKQLVPDSVLLPDSSLLADVQQHFPGILCGPFVPYPLELVLPSIACHLGEHWAAPRQLSAPSDYDEAYYNQSPAARLEFLAALRRVHTACIMALEADFTGKDLFATLSWKESKEAPDYTKEQLWCLTRRGDAWLSSWLNWREMSPAEQLLTALSTVQIANADLGITAEEAKRPPRLFVPDCVPAIEAARFRMLLREFQRALPSKRGKLRPLLARLAPLKVLPLAALREGPACELPARFPTLHWLGLEKRAPDSIEAETFWPDLAQALRTRADWAARAYNIVAVALGGTPTAPAIAEPQGLAATPSPDAATESTGYPWATIDALAERIELRKGGAFLPAGNRIKSAVAGFIDALREAETVPTTDTLPQLYAAFGAHYGREVGVDRVNDTRAQWQRKARKALGLDN